MSGAAQSPDSPSITVSDNRLTESGLTEEAAIGPLPFHVFLGVHSLLIGLLPFYLPVWLWRQGVGLDLLSVMIGISGFSFAAALGPWAYMGQRCRLSTLIAAGLALEVLLVAVCFSFDMTLDGPTDGVIDRTTTTALAWLVILITGIAAGTYNAFFWTTQRALFAASLGADDVGKRYGNFQIYVAVMLKIGILGGGLLLDMDALLILVGLSAVVAIASLLWLSPRLQCAPLLGSAPTILGQTRGATNKARAVFIADGVFLLLESHFWTLSLFLLFGEDFTQLGTLVVALGIVFAILFWLSKNLIDRFAVHHVYVLATILYALSWAFRALLPESVTTYLGPLLIVITFTTSLFRLAFNKRFFEHARIEGVIPYLIWKSRVSQCSIGITFLGIGLALSIGAGSVARDMSTTYLIAALLAPLYLLYPRPPQMMVERTGKVHASLKP